jgi:tRNA dimethylallyltransferase
LSVGSGGAEIAVICGPTAAGKSALAMALAASRPCTIISADSRQVYRGFDIGTSKPTREEQQRVPHRGIDVAEPVDRYSAARWAAAVSGWIEESVSQQRVPIVVGGTGLYLRAAFEGLFDEPELDTSRRRALEEILGSMPRDELQRWVAQLDPVRADLGRTQLLRAIELALLTGHRVSALHRQRERRPRWRARYLLVDPGPALAGRLVARIDAMLDGGWVDEVRSLARTVPAGAQAWNATGYRHVRAMAIDETMTYAAAHEKIVIDTRQYAKRQRTWFRHQLPADRVVRVDPLSPNAADTAHRWLADGETPVPTRTG